MRTEGQTNVDNQNHEVAADGAHTDVSGHKVGDHQTKAARHPDNGGQTAGDNQATCAPTNGSEAGRHTRGNNQENCALPLPDIIADIRYWHRRRIFHMEQRKRSDLALGAELRFGLGWSRSLPQAERTRISKQAQELIKLGEAHAAVKTLSTSQVLSRVGKMRLTRARKSIDVDEPAYDEWRDIIEATVASRAPHDNIEQKAVKELERLANTLPVWPWAEAISGLGALSLATIIAETGDLSDYPAKGHVWKRMGLAPHDGKAYSTWRRTGGLKSADWIAAGYSPRRRSRMWNIGDALVKNGKHYRQIYLVRKDYERAKAAERGLAVAPSAKIPKARAKEFMSDGHIDNRARRYMEKMLLRDLWTEWRRATGIVHDAISNLPVAPLIAREMRPPHGKETTRA